MSNEEKYISIEYQTWLTKYKPMEDEIERLKSEISDNRISIVANRRNTYGGVFEIGYVDIDISKGFMVKIDSQALETTIIQEAEFALPRYYLSRDDAEKKAKEMQEILQKIVDERYKIKRIPLLIRWLFKIKSDA